MEDKMNKTLLIHNPRCSKSREARELLQKLNIQFETIDYLHDGLKEKLLSDLPKLLGLSFSEMVRKKEAKFIELELGDKHLTDKQWILILSENHILLERPIFIHNGRGIIGRPVERIHEIL